jgi:hypothetical protein
MSAEEAVTGVESIPAPAANDELPAPLADDELPEGLVAWWPLKTDTRDATGRGQDGVLMEAKSYLRGFQKGLEAQDHLGHEEPDDGGDAFAVFPGDRILRVNSLTTAIDMGPYSVTLWLRREDNRDWEAYLFQMGRDPQSCSQELVIMLIDDGKVCIWDHDEGVFGFDIKGDFVTTDPIPLREWVHLAVVRDEAGITHLYLNGELNASKEPRHQIAYRPQGVGIGGDVREFGSVFSGGMRDVRVYSLALSESEVRDFVDGGASRVRPANKRG